MSNVYSFSDNLLTEVERKELANFILISLDCSDCAISREIVFVGILNSEAAAIAIIEHQNIDMRQLLHTLQNCYGELLIQNGGMNIYENGSLIALLTGNNEKNPRNKVEQKLIVENAPAIKDRYKFEVYGNRDETKFIFHGTVQYHPMQMRTINTQYGYGCRFSGPNYNLTAQVVTPLNQITLHERRTSLNFSELLNIKMSICYMLLPSFSFEHLRVVAEQTNSLARTWPKGFQIEQTGFLLDPIFHILGRVAGSTMIGLQHGGGKILFKQWENSTEAAAYGNVLRMSCPTDYFFNYRYGLTTKAVAYAYIAEISDITSEHRYGQAIWITFRYLPMLTARCIRSLLRQIFVILAPSRKLLICSYYTDLSEPRLNRWIIENNVYIRPHPSTPKQTPENMKHLVYRANIPKIDNWIWRFKKSILFFDSIGTTTLLQVVSMKMKFVIINSPRVIEELSNLHNDLSDYRTLMLTAMRKVI